MGNGQAKSERRIREQRRLREQRRINAFISTLNPAQGRAMDYRAKNAKLQDLDRINQAKLEENKSKMN